MDADIKDALNQQHNMIQRVLERLDALPSIFVTRQEYSPRHDDIEAGILAPSQNRRVFQIQRKLKDFTLGIA